jgi:DNA adenine methylase
MQGRIHYSSPLRYPGGKEDLAIIVEKIIDQNSLNKIEYAEPYSGGAGLALHLLFDGYVSHIYLNDINSSIFAFWTSIINDTDLFCRNIRDTPVTVDEWMRQSEVINNPEKHSTTELGFAAFFLNRTNYSGIMEGGIIGGKDQNGKYKMDCRFKKESLIERITRVAARKKDITITGLDACDFIRTKINLNTNQCLSFLDPPYYQKGPKLYYNSYKPEDHVSLSNMVKIELKTPWIVTYDDVPEINAMYSEFPTINYEINYSAAEKRKGREVMYCSPDLDTLSN